MFHPSLPIKAFTLGLPLVFQTSLITLHKATELRHLHEYLKLQIANVNETYKTYADCDCWPELEDWGVGTLVWLNAKNIKTKRPSKKLDFKRLGPFAITKKISAHAYRLQLPSMMRGIHDVFHVNLLSKVHANEYLDRHQPPPEPVIIDNENEYEVEEILDSRRLGKGIEFLVRWKGYGPEEDTYEPLKNLANAIDTLDEFQKLHPHKPHATQSQIDKLQKSRTDQWATSRKTRQSH
jgi:hypothetical protein